MEQEKLDQLKAPIDKEHLSVRVIQVMKNRKWERLAFYADNRAVMSRLDDAVGVANWKNKFKHGPDGGVICGISIYIGGEWVTKWDGAENTDIEKVKGGLSNSMRRAAVQWGIGRDIYSLPSIFLEHDPNTYYSFTEADIEYLFGVCQKAKEAGQPAVFVKRSALPGKSDERNKNGGPPPVKKNPGKTIDPEARAPKQVITKLIQLGNEKFGNDWPKKLNDALVSYDCAEISDLTFGQAQQLIESLQRR